MSSTPTRPKNPLLPRLGKALLCTIGVVAGACSILTLLPRASYPGFLASAFSASLAPHLLLAGAIGCIGALTLRKSRGGKATVGLLSALGMLIPAGLTAGIMHSASTAGGSVNPFRAVTLTSMADEPDEPARYNQSDAGTIDVFRPGDTGEPAPILVDIHGGGWDTDA